jgi:hypothetical protein
MLQEVLFVFVFVFVDGGEQDDLGCSARIRPVAAIPR